MIIVERSKQKSIYECMKRVAVVMRCCCGEEAVSGRW